MTKYILSKPLWTSLFLFILAVFLLWHVYTVKPVGPGVVDVVAGHGKQLILYETDLIGVDVGIFSVVHGLAYGGEPPILEEDIHCYDLSDPGAPVFTLLGVRLASVVGLDGNVYVQSVSKRVGESYEQALDDDSGKSLGYFRFTSEGFVQVRGAELARLNAAYESNTLVQLNGYEGIPPRGSGWTSLQFRPISAPPNDTGVTTNTVIIPSVGGKTLSYELRDILDYTPGAVTETVDLRRLGSSGRRRIIFQDLPQRIVSRTAYYAYLKRG